MSYEFDANNEILNLGYAAVGQAPFTMSLWYYPYTVGTVQRRLGVIGADAADHWNLLVETDDTLIWRARDNGTNSDAQSVGTVVDNQWNHCCGVENSDTLRAVWLNGVKNSVGSSSRTPDASTETSIGNRKWVGSESPAQGRIAHFAVWNVALEDEEIASLAAGVAPSEIRPGNLVIYESLLTGPGEFTVSNAVLNSSDGPSVYESPAIVSVEWVDAGASSGGSSVTVPVGAEAVVFVDAAWVWATGDALLDALSLGGNSATLEASDITGDTDHPNASVWYLTDVPSPGSQTLSWTRSEAVNYGGGIAVIFLSGVNTTNPIGATDFDYYNGAAGSASASVETTANDLVLFYCSEYGFTEPDYGDATLVEYGPNAGSRFEAVAIKVASGTSTSNTMAGDSSYPSIIAASIKPAPVQSNPNGLSDNNLLVRYWFDEAAYGTSPTQVNDSSGNDYHLNSFDYNTTYQGVQVVNSNGDISRSANLPSPTNFTVAVWAHADSIRALSYGNVFMFHDSGNNQYLGITHENDSSGDYSLWYSPSGGGITFDTFSSAPAVDTWAYFALRVSGTAIGDVEAMWWNGSSWVKVTNSQAIASLTLSTFYVGRSHTSVDYMLGKFCYVRCWDAVLTDAELEAEKGAILAVRKQNLRWDWPIYNNGDVNDWSENGYAPTLASVNSNSADGPLSMGAYTADANGNRGFASIRHTSYTRVNRLIDHSTPDFLASAWDSGSKFTMEIVYYHKYGSTSNARIFCINDRAANNPKLGMTVYEGTTYKLRFYVLMDGSENYRYYDISPGKYVFHLVVDFTQATAADRMKLYQNGVLQTPGESLTPSNQGATGTTITSDTDLIALNRASGTLYERSPQGIIYYGAIYNDAFDQGRVTRHAINLMTGDDAPSSGPFIWLPRENPRIVRESFRWTATSGANSVPQGTEAWRGWRVSGIYGYRVTTNEGGGGIGLTSGSNNNIMVYDGAGFGLYQFAEATVSGDGDDQFLVCHGRTTGASSSCNAYIGGFNGTTCYIGRLLNSSWQQISSTAYQVVKGDRLRFEVTPYEKRLYVNGRLVLRSETYDSSLESAGHGTSVGIFCYDSTGGWRDFVGGDLLALPAGHGAMPLRVNDWLPYQEFMPFNYTEPSAWWTSYGFIY